MVYFGISRSMNFVFYLFGVTFVVLNTVIFTSVSCQDSDEDILHPPVLYDLTALSSEQRSPIDSFVTTFSDLVNESYILKDLFDISDTPSILFTQFIYGYIYKLLEELGESNPGLFTDFATRPMAQNYEFFPPQSLIAVYANFAAIYMYSEGNLTQNNSNELALVYAILLEKNANGYVVPGDTTTKFQPIANGFLELLTLDSNLTAEKMVKLCYLYQGLWLVTAVETKSSNDMYMKCISDTNEDSNESNSESDSSSSGPGSHSNGSGPDSSGSGPDSNGSGPDSNGSGSDSSHPVLSGCDSSESKEG